MVTEHRHKFDTGKRLITFFQERLASFASGSGTLKLVDAAKGLVAVIEGLFSNQDGATAQLAAATRARANAREQMRESAQALLRTVRTFAPDPPTTAAELDVNRRSDKKLLAAVRALRDHASALAVDIPDHGLPADFIQTLNGTIDAFTAACDAQDRARDAMATSLAGLDKNVKALMDVRRKLDVIVRNQFRGDEATLAVWQKARRIGSGPVQPESAIKSPTQSQTKPATESDTKSATESATGSGTGPDAKSDTRVA